ncbi:hypothetical protein Ocin01_15013 [Orchesella cincta]|uniref:Uncharacterized protein n=1 Tax=Orchesella cincta TaxID=48709 RepID=A0A1D2MFB4_ORCCI|nr:hypothetical protein Ocin01_15013 [Orchesella cincta]
MEQPPSMFSYRGTVIQKIWWQVVLVTIYTAGLVCVSNYVEGLEFKFPQTLIPVLGVVTGLLLVFRTNTAYDRFWEARKLWATMTFNIRTLTRCICVMVAENENTKSKIVDKVSAINLLIAFPYATMHYLRGEYTYDVGKLKMLISHIPKFYNQPLEDQEEEEFSGKSEVNSKKEKNKGASQPHTQQQPETNIPVELSYYIASYINSVAFADPKVADGSTISLMNNALNSLLDCLGGFERILNTPIPNAYSVHLQHATWLYLLSLPYQLIGTLNWFSIPAVGLATFALLGILGIGGEIENPFNNDANDLPLDDYCKAIREEILQIIGHHIPAPELWISPTDNPLAADARKPASKMIKLKEDEVRKMLKKGANLNLLQTNSSDLKSVGVDGCRIKDAANGEELRSMLK